MIVCVCHRVSDRDITRYARDGRGGFHDMQSDLRAGTGCGRCTSCARDVFDAAHPDGATGDYAADFTARAMQACGLTPVQPCSARA